MSQSISTTDHLSIIRSFVDLVGTDVQFANTEDKIRGHMRANLKNARPESYFPASKCRVKQEHAASGVCFYRRRHRISRKVDICRADVPFGNDELVPNGSG